MAERATAGPGAPATQDGPRRGVICAGSIIVDVNATIDHYPARERLALIEDASPSTGGPALNLAVDLRRLGADFPVDLQGVIGGDDHGRFVLDACAALGIGTCRVIRADGAATSYTDVMIERDGGRRTFFHHIGANGLLRPEHVDVTVTLEPGTPAGTLGSATPRPGTHGSGDPASGDPVGGRPLRPKLLHLGAPGLHPLLDAPDPYGGNGFSRVLAAAQSAGLRTNLELVSVDPERIRRAALPCLPHLDYLVINEVEAQALTGLGSEVASSDGAVDWPALEASAARLVELGVARLAVVHFPAGCVAAAPRGTVLRQGCVRMPAGSVRSTVGAGDAFAAGVLLGLHDDRPVEDCLELGVAAAAVSLLGRSTSDSLLPAGQCLDFARRNGFRDSH
ncbi:MAG TPA: carbohydrate kinase family protein [Kineosporiaceae bacterium]|nr:carbohydrate kinase family protein [Kineosporiaceae bacterium]